MSRDDALHIFNTFWRTEGYAGIVKHLPTWSKSRASNFAYRHGIKMEPDAKARILQAMAENSSNTRKNHHAKPVVPERTMENRVLMGRW